MKVAIVGSGQLARLLALAGERLNLECCFLAELQDDTSSVEGLGKIIRRSPGASAESVFSDLGEPDVITTEKEHIDIDLYKALAELTRVHPNPEAVGIASDRIRERTFLQTENLPTPKCAFARDSKTIADAFNAVGLPCVVKAATHGYDGKNQWLVEDHRAVAEFLSHYSGQPVLVEQHVKFDFEVSLVAVRSAYGQIRYYSLTRNYHHKGVLVRSEAPLHGPETHHLEQQAQRIVRQTLESLDYVGVLAMEFFVVGDELLINEIAPRVHNSGHWTLDGTNCSQFENHLRAITHLELKETQPCGFSEMHNLLGRSAPEHWQEIPGLTLYWYDKAVKPGRKVGHFNLNHKDRAVLQRSSDKLEKMLTASAI